MTGAVGYARLGIIPIIGIVINKPMTIERKNVNDDEADRRKSLCATIE